jgi:hypothetical protein
MTIKAPLYAPVLDDDKTHISRVWRNYFDSLAAQMGSGILAITGTAPIDVSGGSSPVVSLAGHGVSNPYLAQMPAMTLKGNDTSGAANAADLTASQVLALLGLSSVITGAGTANNVTIFTGPHAVGNAPGFTYDPGEGGSYTISAAEVNVSALNATIVNASTGEFAGLLATTATIDTLTIAVGVRVASLTASLPVFSDGSGNLVSNPMTGTGSVMMSASPTTTGIFSGENAAFAGRINVNGATDSVNYGVNVLQKNVSATRVGFNGGQLTSFAAGSPGSANSEMLRIYHTGAGTGALIEVSHAGTGTDRDLNIQVGGITALIASASAGYIRIPVSLNLGGATNTSGYAVNVPGSYVATSGNAGTGFQAFGIGVPGGANVEYTELNHYGTGGGRILVGTSGGSYRNFYINTGGLDRFTFDQVGNITVSGNVGTSGGAALPNYLMNIAGTASSTLDQGGIFINVTGSASGSLGLRGQTIQMNSSAGSYSMANEIAINIPTMGKGAGSTLGAFYGMYIAAQASVIPGSNERWAVYAEDSDIWLANGYIYANNGIIFSGGGDNLNYFASGSYAGVLTGVTGAVTGTIYWERIGNTVTLTLPGFQGTSNSSQCTITGMPAAIRPARLIAKECVLMDNSVEYLAPGCGVTISTSGLMEFYLNFTITGFTASGLKGLPSSLEFIGSSWSTLTYTIQ